LYNPLADLTLDGQKEQVSKTASDVSDQVNADFRWIAEMNGEAIGSASLSSVSWSMGYAQIGYAIAEKHHGKGLGTKVVSLLVGKIFADSELQRLIAYVSTENVASWRLLERLGFTREGCLRQHYVINGRRVDEYLYAIMRSEWPANETRGLPAPHSKPFALIYKWKLKPGSELSFQEAWARRTLEIKRQHGALGSRLHRCEDGSWIAYAQWPSRSQWDGANMAQTEQTEASKMMNAATESIETLYRLDVVSDLLEHW
jgi:ribosomal-protein-alanine N-acetyltransferase